MRDDGTELRARPGQGAARGVSEEVLATLRHAGIDLKQWLTGFDSVEAGVRESVGVIRNHPLLPRDVAVHGMLMDSDTGALKLIVEGYGKARQGHEIVEVFYPLVVQASSRLPACICRAVLAMVAVLNGFASETAGLSWTARSTAVSAVS